MFEQLLGEYAWVVKLILPGCILGVCLFCYVNLKLLTSLSKRGLFMPAHLPSYLKTMATLQYLILLKDIYKRSKPSTPALCLLLQLACGMCHIFERTRIFRVYLLFKPLFVLYKPETVEVVLGSATIIEKSKEYEFLQPWLGTGLLTSSGRKWRYRRKLLTPAFHFAVLEDFVPVFHEQSSVLASNLEALAHEPWVDIVPLMTSCTLDIICQTAMGVRINAQGGGHADYRNAIYEIGDTFLYRALRPWLYPDIIFYATSTGRRFKRNLNQIHSFTRKVIKEKKECMIKFGQWSPTQEVAPDVTTIQKRKRRAFLESLLELHLNDPAFTMEDIREEVDTFMFEGHDTTAMALSWAVYFLGLYKDVQNEVHNELDDIFQGDVEREITREDLRQMRYLECVIKETLRLYPSVPFIAREVNENFKILDYSIKKGSLCFIFPLMLHRDPESFPEPEKFDPERFFPENCTGRHPYAYVPFSAGPRNCIGQKFALMEEKTVLANIFRRFQVSSLDQRDEVNVMSNLIIRNVKPLRVKFTQRQ